jgi:hypothetical protein
MTGMLPPLIRTHLDAPKRMNLTDRAKRTSPSRRALTVAGITTVAFSLIVSIGPALAAAGGNGNGNSNGNGTNAGTVKVHDAATSLEAGLIANEPWVCSFWVAFYSDNDEAGSWELRSWAPTGDGSVVADGAYDTSGDGVDATTTLALADGHYRLEWQPEGSNSKQKTFWVACDEAASSTEASPADEVLPSEDASPSEDEVLRSDEATPSDEVLPSGKATPSDEVLPSGEATPSDEVAAPNDEESTPGSEAGNTGNDPDPSQQPEGQVKAGTSDPDHGTEGSVGSIPDTATAAGSADAGLGGILAAIGVLLIVIAHAGTRSERILPTA